MQKYSSAAGTIATVALMLMTAAGSARPPQSMVETLIRDMSFVHEAQPAGVPDSVGWAVKPRVGMGAKVPDGWRAATMWGQVYAARGGNPAVNVRVEIRQPVLLYLSKRDGKWHDLQRESGVAGAAYREDFAGDENQPADLKRTRDGSVSVRIVLGHNFHFWPAKASRATIEPGDVAGMASAFRARLVTDDPAAPDDRGKARLLASCGGDYWRALNAGWKSDWSNNGDWAIGRFRFLTPVWQVFTATTLDAGDLRRNPPTLYP